MRLRGYIAARSTIRGVDIHSQLRTIFIIATHQLNTRTTNPLPILPLPYTVHLSSSNRPLSFTHHPPIVLPLPLFLIILFSPIYNPILPHKSQKKTPHSNYIYPQSEFFKLPIDKYLKITYNKLIKGG